MQESHQLRIWEIVSKIATINGDLSKAGHFSNHLLIPHVRRKSALASHGLAQRVNLAGLVHCLIGRVYKSMFLKIRISTLRLAVSAGKTTF